MKWKFKQHSVLPGFGMTLGVALTYLGLIVLLPLSLLVWNTSSLSWSEFLKVVCSAQIVASYKLTFGASFLAAVVNAVFGFIAAWTLTRYRFPGKKLLDAIVDMPFAMPTAVSGIALTTIYAPNGWIGYWFAKAGMKIAYTPIGVFIALTFIGLPFVVRTLQPSLDDLDKEIEEAAESLGATKWQTFWRVILPSVLPALATGFTLAFARALGEYGSVVFISGNLPMKTEITALLIYTKLEQFDYAGATAISVVMLGASFVLMLIINMTQWYARKGKK
ncbi:MAG: sulfate ABC transporter permease subunit CysT [Planctomycetaceae bacterium]|jgi:sulfate transport system permease protein|nr:sulfate ABC transporter permease subunit CysT [Planctomycetaceae bacterium]